MHWESYASMELNRKWYTALFTMMSKLISPMQIVNWRTNLKFPEEAKLSAEAKDLIRKLLCNVEQRLGTKGSYEIKVRILIVLPSFIVVCKDDTCCQLWSSSYQAHPWFKDIEWDRLYQIEAAFIPEVNSDLDTQNFEKFEEVSGKGLIANRNLVWFCRCASFIHWSWWLSVWSMPSYSFHGALFPSFLAIFTIICSFVFFMYSWGLKYNLRPDQVPGER